MSNFLDLPAGLFDCWVVDCKYERGDNESPRNKVTLFFSDKPSAEGHDGKTTKQSVYLPLSSDNVQAQIAMERRVKSVLFPLAGLTPEAKVSIRILFEAIQKNLTNHDIAVALEVEHRPGKGMDINGNPKIFTDILSLNPKGFKDKKAYESNIDYDDSELPF